MKITKKNNEDKLDLIINKITNIETRIDNIENRIEKIEKNVSLILACHTIKKEISQIQK